MASRPLVQVQGTKEQLKVPSVLLSPIRTDVVQFVHSSMNKNHRQAHAVSPKAGHQTSAASWGTGRAVARIPRVAGGGTHRSGQGAFGNMCRKGRMFAPIKVWKRWHRPINQKQRRFAVCAALAASAIPALVMARGHRVDAVPEVPLVVASESLTKVTKTKDAVALLEKLGAGEDVERVKDSRTLRAGKGKMRNRRFVQRRGPLLVHTDLKSAESALVRAFRNVPGLECCPVQRLNLLQLAPGGHVGRFIIWTRDAFERLDAVFGTHQADSQSKKGWRPPHSQVANPDLARTMGADEVRAALTPAKPKRAAFRPRKLNPLKNLGAAAKLNPYALALRRRAILAQQQSKDTRDKQVKAARKARVASAKAAPSTKAFQAILLSKE